MDPGIVSSAPLNGDLLLVLADGQTVLTAPVLYVIRLFQLFQAQPSVNVVRHVPCQPLANQ